MQQVVLTERDQQYILQALSLGLQAIKEHKGSKRVAYYDILIREVMKHTDELRFLLGLQRIMEAIEGELNECVK